VSVVVEKAFDEIAGNAPRSLRLRDGIHVEPPFGRDLAVDGASLRFAATISCQGFFARRRKKGVMPAAPALERMKRGRVARQAAITTMPMLLQMLRGVLSMVIE
jgi:hypothetical protein